MGNLIEVKIEPTVTADKMSKVIDLIWDRTSISNRWNSKDAVWGFMRKDIGFRYRNDNGKFPRRLKNYLYRNLDISLDNSVVEQIGNIVSGASRTATVFVDVGGGDAIGSMTKGEFADSDSCFFQGYADNRYRMALDPKERFGIIKVYDKDSNGLGRCFTYQDTNRFAIFNCYGLQSDEFITIAEQVYETSLTRARMEISGVYVNDDRCYSDTEGSMIEIDRMSRVRHCGKCRDWDLDKKFVSIRGDNICSRCSDGMTTTCTECDELTLNDHMRDTSHGAMCRNCESKMFASCYHCKDVVYRREIQWGLCVTCQPLKAEIFGDLESGIFKKPAESVQELSQMLTTLLENYRI